MLKYLFFMVGFSIVLEGHAQNTMSYDFETSAHEIEYRQNSDSTLTTLYNRRGKTLNGTYKVTQKDSSVHYMELRDGLWNGRYITHYKSGELASEETYEMGIKKDTGIWYYKNGERKRTISYKNRKKHGLCTWYYRSGKPLKKCTYVDDKEEGVCKWYFAKGNLKWLVTYERGIKSGNVQKYKSSGTQEFNGYFLNDVQVSKAVFDKAQSKQ